MAYITPVTDWAVGDIPTEADFNRAEGNTAVLANLRAFQTAGGTGTAITVTTGYFELTDGRAITFIAANNNSGAATTINTDSTGAKPVYKPGGTTAPIFIAGKAYTVWYNTSGGCFFLKANAEGLALVADVLAGKTFSNDEDTGIVGTMPDRSGDTEALSSVVSGTTLKLRASDGYRDGANDYVTIDDADFDAANIKSGINIFGITGTYNTRVLSVGAVEQENYLYTVQGGTSSGTYAKLVEFTFTGVSGAFTFAWTQAIGATGGGKTGYVKIYKNDVAYGTEHSSILASSEQTENVTIADGDKLALYGKISTGAVSLDVYLIKFLTKEAKMIEVTFES
jgi:hypothetical protein